MTTSSETKSALILEENKGLIGTMREILKQENFRVVLAHNGAEALSLHKQQKFDLALFDINMSKVDDVNYVNELRRIHSDVLIPIVIMGGNSKELLETLNCADQIGCLDKPFNGQQLMQAIKSCTNFDSPSDNSADEGKVYVANGDYLINEGEVENKMFLIMKGEFNITKKKSDGSEMLLSTIGAGEIVGEMSFLDESPRSASVIAVGECEVVVIPRAKFENVISKQPKWFKSLLLTLTKRLRAANDQLRDKD